MNKMWLLLAMMFWTQSVIAQTSAPGSQPGLILSPTLPETLSADPANAVPATTPRLAAKSPSSVLTSPIENTAAPAFGHWIFTGQFAQESFKGFNPDYRISIGDHILVKLWGAFDNDLALDVDSQGNIFLPRVGPLRVQNVRNEDLNKVVAKRVKDIYRENVGVYATLDGAQPVRIFVSGFVRSPGLYTGFAADSILHFLDKAGGIDSTRGSFLDIKLRRGDSNRATINLYDFLLHGEIPSLQLHDGDSIVVGSLQSTVQLIGLVENPSTVEFKGDKYPLASALDIVGVKPQATHARIVHNRGLERTAEYIQLTEAGTASLQSGDEVEIVADRTLRNVLVHVDGEHLGRSEFVLPYGATIGDLIKQIELAPESRIDSLQLFRLSQATRQKEQLQLTLQTLETQVLSARSSTVNEADLREREAKLVLQFIDRARNVQPRGQVVVPVGALRDELTLEDGDRVVIPKKSSLVAVHGEVYLPTVLLHRGGADAEDYINLAGGYSQKADRAHILLLHQNGEIEQCQLGLLSSEPQVRPGDEILVLPAVDLKYLQVTSTVVQILYQLAVGSGVIVRLLGL